MAKRIDGYWIHLIAPSFHQILFTLPRLPPGTNVYASISLSEVNTRFDSNDTDPKFAVNAQVSSFTFYNPDGTESTPQTTPQTGPPTTLKNAISVENCATITFVLSGSRVAAFAQISVFTF
jgi:hypothetical protein